MLPFKDKADNYNTVAGGITPGNRLGKTHMSVSPQPQMNQPVISKMKDVAESKNQKGWNISTKVKKPVYTKSQLAAKEAEDKKAAQALAKATPVS